MLKRCSTCQKWRRLLSRDPDVRQTAGYCEIARLLVPEVAICSRWRPRACYEKLAKSEGK